MRAARFIPARAGNTSPGARRLTGPTVHPRAGGEHSCYKELINNNFCTVKERTRFLLPFLVIIKLLKLVEPFRRRPVPEVRNSRA